MGVSVLLYTCCDTYAPYALTSYNLLGDIIPFYKSCGYEDTVKDA